MNRSLFWLALLIVAAPTCIAQRVIYSSQLISQSYQGPAIKKIRAPGRFSSTITVKYTDGRKQIIPRDSIWGYEDARGRLYRNYKREFYRVTAVSDLVRYVVTRSNGRGVVNTRYFSRDFDSALYWGKAKARRDSSQAL
ncbi:hypothetical protein [Spirosoma pollinicola]|uniref:Uncharacterized protein n=1 Tax=Spirosoma pollinicola TaxID=2057025 RepID=A0A2K8Z7W0_9BACT|nr:hypothetical protein [Spirosoma pollinicola]AUD05976.1 hypothetical protein CWM47_31505 [Spirosoma pollinicola]